MIEFHPTTAHVVDGPVLNGWHTSQSHREVIAFAHGNGFSCRVYQPMLDLIAEHYDLLMYDLPGHGRSPSHEFVGHARTALFLQQAVTQSQEIIAGRNVHVVAHSLGGMLTMLAASERPGTFASMVLLDPIMFPKPLLMLMHVVSRLGLTGLFHPHVEPTLRRRNGWADKQEAFAYFHHRKVFDNWTDAALNSYIEHALRQDSSKLTLCCDPQLEAKWFATLPSKFWPSVEKLRLPVSIFMGQDTYPFSLRAGSYANKINPAIDYKIVPGSHCFMQEYPQSAATYVLETLAGR